MAGKVLALVFGAQLILFGRLLLWSREGIAGKVLVLVFGAQLILFGRLLLWSGHALPRAAASGSR